MKQPLIRFDHITRSLTDGETTNMLINDVSFTVGRGEFLAITGPSGSGKSSLLYLMGLLDTPTSGKIFLDGIDTTTASPERKERLRLEKIGFVFQFHFLLPEFTVRENLLLPIRKLGRLDEQSAIAHSDDLLAAVNMEAYSQRYPGQLSGGQRQRVAIARALANEPDIILADEPTGNLDSKNADAVFDIFAKLVADHNQTVIMITHEQELAERASRRINIVDGKIA